MSQPWCTFALMFGVALSLFMPVLGIAAQSLPEGDGPFLVLAMPFQQDVSEIIGHAGGMVVGPKTSAISAISANASASDLVAAGAFSVLAVDAIPFLCSTKSLQ